MRKEILEQLEEQLNILNNRNADDQSHYDDVGDGDALEASEYEGSVIHKALELIQKLKQPVQAHISIRGGLVAFTSANIPMEMIIVDHDQNDHQSPMTWNTRVDYLVDNVAMAASNSLLGHIVNAVDFYGVDVTAVNPETEIEFTGRIHKNKQGQYLKLDGQYINNDIDLSSVKDNQVITVVVIDQDDQAFDLPLWCITEFE